ncbi:MAG: helix-turn-helix transcriptional regulator [Clostridia bacterium]|nr:helix-turn-helix transcriptional regulator [Clostridia bacterium]
MSEELLAICNRILQAINAKEISYGELSKATGIPKSALQRYATGETRKIPLDRIQLIAQATGVSAAWIMGWENEPLGVTQKVGKLTQHEEKVVLAYRDKPAIQPAVDKLLDISPSEEPEILVAARGSGYVSPETIKELIDKIDTLPDFVD